MEQNFAYLAGLIDGDGCISMYKKKDKKAISGFTYAPYMKIISKDLWFLEKIQLNYGGRIWKGTKSGFKKGNFVYELWFNSTEIRKILPEIIPHLILKREQALLLLQAVSITKYHRNKNYVQVAALDYIVEKLKDLKQNTLTILN